MSSYCSDLVAVRNLPHSTPETPPATAPMDRALAMARPKADRELSEPEVNVVCSSVVLTTMTSASVKIDSSVNSVTTRSFALRRFTKLMTEVGGAPRGG